MAGGRTLPEWLRFQESLHPRWMDLDLGRVRDVWARLGTARPAGPVFTVAGTNGKGSSVALLEAFLARAGRRVGAYTSPHLVDYNERVRVAGTMATDDELVAAFGRVDCARGDTPLTFFEFGTLAAFEVFRARGCDAWVLEVGMGGRLDAVNVVDADFAIITTVDLDHQEYLGDTVEKIAVEKAGILRSGRPGFYGDWPVPRSLRAAAAACGAELRCLGHDFDFTPSRPSWSWRGQRLSIDGLAWPPAGALAQLRNASVVLAALEQHEPALLSDAAAVSGIVAGVRPPGRFQRIEREHEWILDVAHNPQAVATLRERLDALPPAARTTVVLGILGDKDLDAFVATLGDRADAWVCCSVEDARARDAASIAARLRELGAREVVEAGAPEAALAAAAACTPRGGRILVCGSFRVVGPALRWLGIY
jgi:dihydrofolate synthase/folylpolyglutamate synthase